jgi:nucleotide-binding universal stress UspA family protein
MTDDRTEDHPQRVVVGVDGSEGSRRALQWAASEARQRHAVLEVVHAWHIPYVGGYPYAAGTLDWGVIEAGAKTVLEREIASVAPAGLAGPVKGILCGDAAAQAIVTVSKGADLVVVGSRGHGGFAGLLLGSVSQQVVHHAGCPVVVVPDPT